MSLFSLPCRRLFFCPSNVAAIVPAFTHTRHLSNSAVRSERASKPPDMPHSKPAVPSRPSSSVVLLSPENKVLLLHRVQTSTSFASAHVFPGGNLDPYHDGDVPHWEVKLGEESPESNKNIHQDGPSYRMGAIRETFEETGILLAKKADGSGELVRLKVAERDAARKKIHGNQVKFQDWVKSVGGIPDTENLLPFTRWITPRNLPKRFTTQMYLYCLPLATKDRSLTFDETVPTPDGGVEHTAATFAPAQSFLARQLQGEIILFPPQAYLLSHVAQHISEDAKEHAQRTSERAELLKFLARVPSGDKTTALGEPHWAAKISWADKVMSPHNLFVRGSDGRVVLGLDKPGDELKGSGRGGDAERVALVRFSKAGPSEVEIRNRQEVIDEENEYKKQSKL